MSEPPNCSECVAAGTLVAEATVLVTSRRETWGSSHALRTRKVCDRHAVELAEDDPNAIFKHLDGGPWHD